MTFSSSQPIQVMQRRGKRIRRRGRKGSHNRTRPTNWLNFLCVLKDRKEKERDQKGWKNKASLTCFPLSKRGYFFYTTQCVCVLFFRTRQLATYLPYAPLHVLLRAKLRGEKTKKKSFHLQLSLRLLSERVKSSWLHIHIHFFSTVLHDDDDDDDGDDAGKREKLHRRNLNFKEN